MSKMSPILMPRSGQELDDWLARSREEAIEPDLPIIDAHHHVWLGQSDAYQLPEFLAEIGGGHDIRATIFAQCGTMFRADGPDAFKPVGETEYVNGVAAASASGLFGEARVCAGIIGFADLRLGGSVADVLQAHMRAGGERFKGIRQPTQFDQHFGMTSPAPPLGEMLANDAFCEGFACLGQLGLIFDAWVYFSQLPDLAALARRFPDTQIVVNHIGAPLGIGYYADRRAEVFDAWSHGMDALAALPNIAMKLGGLGMTTYGFGFEKYETPAPSTEIAAAWKPYIEYCIEKFGTKRALFESNFPVDKQTCSYTTLWNAFKHITSAYSNDEKLDLYCRTASQIYALDERFTSVKTT